MSKLDEQIEVFKRELGNRITEYCDTEPVAAFDMVWVGEQVKAITASTLQEIMPEKKQIIYSEGYDFGKEVTERALKQSFNAALSQIEQNAERLGIKLEDK